MWGYITGRRSFLQAASQTSQRVSQAGAWGGMMFLRTVNQAGGDRKTSRGMCGSARVATHRAGAASARDIPTCRQVLEAPAFNCHQYIGVRAGSDRRTLAMSAIRDRKADTVAAISGSLDRAICSRKHRSHANHTGFPVSANLSFTPRSSWSTNSVNMLRAHPLCCDASTDVPTCCVEFAK